MKILLCCCIILSVSLVGAKDKVVIAPNNIEFQNNGINNFVEFDGIRFSNIDVITPHNRINQIVPFDFIISQSVVSRNQELFKRNIIVIDGFQTEQIVLNNAATQFNAFNFGFNHFGFSQFDFLVNRQFFFDGNLIRQFVVNDVVVAQEFVPSVITVQFIEAFNKQNFAVLNQVRTQCQYNVY